MPSTPLIEFEKEKMKPIWEAYQILWADVDHNELLPILAWDNNNNRKEKQREKPTWKATIDTWTNNNQSEMPPILDWEEKNKEKGKGREENIPEETTTTEKITSGWERKYSCEPIKELPYIPLKCKDCGKKLSSMRTWVVLDKNYWMRIHYYCKSCHREQYGYSKRQDKIYMIPEEEEPINSCASELESSSNPNSNSDNNNNKNNSSSSVQNGYNNDNDSNAESNSNLNYKQYIALSDLTKEQELKWFSNNDEGNIIVMLQNDSEKAYVIEPNERIAQTIFLPLVKIAQLVSVENREELGITAREIQGFGSMSKIDVPVNMVEEEIIGQGEIISTGQTISIPLYSQYMLAIKKREKKQEQIFEAEATLCESGEIGLINLHIPAKSHNHIKIPIYKNTENVVKITEGTTLKYLTTEIEDQAPSSIPDFPQLCGYVDITSQTIYRQNKCYLLQPEQLEQMNMRNLDSFQQMQLKMLLNNFNDIFTSENKFGKTDIIQHQIKTGNAMPIKQQAYRLETKDLNSETLATYFQELNFNIIKYCEETYPVQSQYSIDFELETETSNKGKHKLKQYLKTTPNTPILPKTTAKHLQTPEQGTTANEENNSEISKEESIDSENEKDEMTAYITKIPEFNRKDIETSPQEWLDQVTKAGDANGWNAARILRTIPYFLKGTAGKCYLTIPKEQDFYHIALSEGKAAARQQNLSYTLITISLTRIVENANFSNIFPFEFEANESPFLFSNTVINEQKAITAMYTEAKVKRKTICLILDSEFTRSIITYQLMQQLKRNVD
ncbi:hypothetical protein G9A89_019979 [Geosiphon pyriformis]|nr:hypothetical protein G9A89_019979 [Geosiphon pyriformis]